MVLQTVWGWQPSLYLFLGGMGAGAMVMAGVLWLLFKEKVRKTICASYWAAAIALVVGLLCLLSELTNPLRGMMLWQSFSNFTSWMTFGAWVVFAAVVVGGIAALVSVEKVSSLLHLSEKAQRTVISVCAILGIVLGFCVAAYTGILLMSAPGVPFWGSPLLPCLFTVSGIDTGIALVEVIGCVIARREALPHKAHRLMETCVVVLVVLEVIVLMVFLLTTAGSNAQVAAYGAQLLLTGGLSAWFWGLVVVCGLALPLAASVAALVRGKSAKASSAPASVAAEADGIAGAAEAVSSSAKAVSGSTTVLIGAVGALLGGCALRFLIVMAGIHGDPVGSTMVQLFSDLAQTL